MLSKHTCYAIGIPLVLFFIFHFIYKDVETKERHASCTYVNASLCIQHKEGSSTVETVDLKDYGLQDKQYKTNDEVIYATSSIEEIRFFNYLIVICCLILLGVLIRFPQVFGFLGNLDF